MFVCEENILFMYGFTSVWLMYDKKNSQNSNTGIVRFELQGDVVLSKFMETTM